MLTRPALIALIGPLLALAVGACSASPSTPKSALSLPIDFAFACEGDGKTTAPQNDETASSLTQTRMCPDLPDGTEGHLFGAILNREPASLVLAQLNPAAGTRTLIDTDYFVPGTTGIPVGRGPIRVLRAPDWSAFLVVSAQDERVDVIRIEDYDGEFAHWSQASFPLPGTPGEALVAGTNLVVAAQDKAELWVYDLAAGFAGDLSAGIATPPSHVVALPDQALRIEVADDALALTFRTRPTLVLLGLDGATLAEVGLVPACRNGLDDDDDGLADKADPDCLNAQDDDESTATGAVRPTPPAAVVAFAGAGACDNGIDDDGDGLTDAFDPACADDLNGELIPGCSDGVDDDGDGLTDMADESCYQAEGARELRLPDDGPFDPTFIDGGAAGRFVYVLDERIGEVLVFAYADHALTRVDVNATNATPPTLTSVPFGDPSAEPTTHDAIPAVRFPAYARQGRKNIVMETGNAMSLSSSQVRGELWSRLIADQKVPNTPQSGDWQPDVCAPPSDTTSDACHEPAGDDQTWLAFGANLDGKIQLFEAIRRGTPVHRLAQRVTDPALRKHEVTAPKLSVRGHVLDARGEPTLGYPFIGPAAQEQIAEADDTHPERLRRYGIWPPSDLETAPSETWTVTFEGIIPGTLGHGRLVDQATFYDADAAFCEEGVAAGDWLQFEVPVASVAPELVTHVDLALSTGQACATFAPETALIEVPVTAVGMSTLTIDGAGARLRPVLPKLDRTTIRAARMSVTACEEALQKLSDSLGKPEHLASTIAFGTANMPAYMTYRVRVGNAWAVVGQRSGFLHRNRWDRTAGVCSIDAALDPRLTGRAVEVPGALAKYATCPPSDDQLSATNVTQIAPEAGRFENPSFALDMFPGCTVGDDKAIAAAPSQQDTTFSFTVTGPQGGSALSLSNSLLLTRVPMLDFRRQQVQLDTSANRAAILQFRLGDPQVIVTFE